MTHPTDDELDALVGMLQQRDKSKHGYTGHPLYNRNGPQAVDALTALRAQLATLQLHLDSAHDKLEIERALTDGAHRRAREAEAEAHACGDERDAANARADRAEAALAAQIEADAKPALRLSIARKMGMYGSAYDGPFDARAYTYDHQPGNQAAWAIGRAASNATLDKVGDYIDRGLGLLRHLKAEGFGVFALNNNDTHDRTALDRMRRAEREKALREAADAFMDGSAPRMTILTMIERQ